MINFILATDTTLENNVNAIDPVKINNKDLIARSILDTPELGGNGTYKKLLETDLQFKKDLNEQLKDYGTKTNRVLTTTTATDEGMSASLHNQVSNSSTVAKSQSYSPNAGAANPYTQNNYWSYEGTDEKNALKWQIKLNPDNSVPVGSGGKFELKDTYNSGNDLANEIKGGFDNNGYKTKIERVSPGKEPSRIIVTAPSGGQVIFEPTYNATTKTTSWHVVTAGKLIANELTNVMGTASKSAKLGQ